VSPTQAKVPETKKTAPSTRSGGKQPKPEIANPTLPTERKPWFDPSRIGWDLAAVLFLALGPVLGLAVLGFTRGVIPDLILGSARRWFGLGRYLLPLALFGSGWLLLLWRNGRGAPFFCWPSCSGGVGFALPARRSLSFFGRDCAGD